MEKGKGSCLLNHLPGTTFHSFIQPPLSETPLCARHFLGAELWMRQRGMWIRRVTLVPENRLFQEKQHWQKINRKPLTHLTLRGCGKSSMKALNFYKILIDYYISHFGGKLIRSWKKWKWKKGERKKEKKKAMETIGRPSLDQYKNYFYNWRLWKLKWTVVSSPSLKSSQAQTRLPLVRADLKIIHKPGKTWIRWLKGAIPLHSFENWFA